ncbi:MAG: cytochrome-c oxidase, cbb3-type subunit III [Pseudomonadota bacterium]
MPTKIEKDAITGQETTGHEWDGVKELNSPLPKWWLYVFYATVAFSLLWYILYPAIPYFSGHTPGLLNTTARKQVTEAIAVAEAARGERLQGLAAADISELENNPDLYQLAARMGEYPFADNCAPCHGLGGAGQQNYPSLADDAWLWGGTLAAIDQTITYGIRNADPDSRYSEMPAYDGVLEGGQIEAVADYVLSLSGAATAAESTNLSEGKQLFEENCVACHGDDGKGIYDLGAPNLTDAIWLYGGTKDAIVSQVTHPQNGVMPPWHTRLDSTTIKSVAAYVHSLGGGQ